MNGGGLRQSRAPEPKTPRILAMVTRKTFLTPETARLRMRRADKRKDLRGQSRRRWLHNTSKQLLWQRRLPHLLAMPSVDDRSHPLCLALPHDRVASRTEALRRSQRLPAAMIKTAQAPAARIVQKRMLDGAGDLTGDSAEAEAVAVVGGVVGGSSLAGGLTARLAALASGPRPCSEIGSSRIARPSSPESQSAAMSRSRPGSCSLRLQLQLPQRNSPAACKLVSQSESPENTVSTRPRPKTGKTIGPVRSASLSQSPSSSLTR